MERPTYSQLVKVWQLECNDDIAHVIEIPYVTRHKIERFTEEPSRCADEFCSMEPLMADSPINAIVKTTPIKLIHFQF